MWPKFELIKAFMHVPARIRMIKSKMKALECSRDFSHYKYVDFSSCSRAANSAVHSPIWPNFKHVRDIMDVLVTCKYEEDPIKNEGVKSVHSIFPIITLWELSVAMETRVPI